ncbi:MAG: type II toxin-antitoxin system HicB family antitoxin [Mycobacteriales bacterium]
MQGASFGGSNGRPELDTQTVARYLAVPYVAVFSSTVDDNGVWVRSAAYPELPGCHVEAATVIEAMDDLEDLRVALIVDMLSRGEEPPVPRPPLMGGSSGLAAETLAHQVLKARAD